jgi:CRP/FNR family transcriptional regulator
MMAHQPDPKQLRTYPLLETLNDQDLGLIGRFIRSRDLEKDQVLLLEGETPTGLYFTAVGWLKAEKVSPEGRQQVLRYIGPGEVLNEFAVFSGKPNAASFIALTPAEIFYIPMKDVNLLLHNHSRFSRAVIQSLSNRIEHLVNLVSDLSLHTVQSRLARLLLENAQNGVFIRQSWETQAEIAARLGTVLDVLNRALQRFTREGLIDLDRDAITLLKPDALENIAHSSSQTST